MKVITIHQVKSLPTAPVSNLIPEFEYTTIFFFLIIPLSNEMKKWVYLDFFYFFFAAITFLQSAVLSEVLYVKANQFSPDGWEVPLIDHGQRGSHL